MLLVLAHQMVNLSSIICKWNLYIKRRKTYRIYYKSNSRKLVIVYIKTKKKIEVKPSSIKEQLSAISKM